MPQFEVRPFKPQNNIDILNAIRKTASTDYRSRIPLADQENIKLALQRINEAGTLRNEFYSALIQRIGLVIYKNNTWANPLSWAKKGLIQMGETVEEIQTGLMKARTYSAEREYLEKDNFGIHTLDVQASYHHRNRQDTYTLTVNQQELTKAFTDEGYLSSFISGLMDAPSTSDAWDEYLLMVRLFKEYYDNDGFFKVQVPDVSSLTTDPDDSKMFIKVIRAMVDTLPFISTHYNAAGMPVAAKADELRLFITPNANANMDVDALAAAFNINRSQISTKQTIIRPEDLGITGAQAILTTDDFFQVYDTYMDTASQQNPAGRTVNYFLHHDGIYSASRFVPAILFTTEPGDAIVITDPQPATITDIVVSDTNGTPVTDLPRGAFYNTRVVYTTTPANGEAPLALRIVGAESDYTVLRQNGTLFIGFDETAASIDIVASDNDGVPTRTETFTLSGDVLQEWPPKVIPEADAEA